MTRYALANHVFVCLQDEHVVFLDVRQDRYFALDAARAGGLAAAVRGWPARAGFAEQALVSEAQVVALLVRRGLLTDESRIGKDATPTRFDAPVDEIVAEDFTGSLAMDPLTIYRFLAACISAHTTLKYVSFERMVGHVRERNARAAGTTLDRERAHRAIAAFASLRPYFFTAKDACLFEALALGRFLARYGMHPRWVFGVQARPFAAHCWLQHDGVVLNDTAEHVGRYAPIMVV